MRTGEAYPSHGWRRAGSALPLPDPRSRRLYRRRLVSRRFGPRPRVFGSVRRVSGANVEHAIAPRLGAARRGALALSGLADVPVTEPRTHSVAAIGTSPGPTRRHEPCPQLAHRACAARRGPSSAERSRGGNGSWSSLQRGARSRATASARLPAGRFAGYGGSRLTEFRSTGSPMWCPWENGSSAALGAVERRSTARATTSLSEGGLWKAPRRHPRVSRSPW